MDSKFLWRLTSATITLARNILKTQEYRLINIWKQSLWLYWTSSNQLKLKSFKSAHNSNIWLHLSLWMMRFQAKNPLICFTFLFQNVFHSLGHERLWEIIDWKPSTSLTTQLEIWLSCSFQCCRISRKHNKWSSQQFKP